LLQQPQPLVHFPLCGFQRTCARLRLEQAMAREPGFAFALGMQTLRIHAQAFGLRADLLRFRLRGSRLRRGLPPSPVLSLDRLDTGPLQLLL